MTDNKGYAWPAGRAASTYDPAQRDEEIRAARAETALMKLLDWGRRDVAAILGLLPDDDPVVEEILADDVGEQDEEKLAADERSRMNRRKKMK